MDGNQDYYEILGLPRNAPQDDIRRAYRKLARQYHPDISTAHDAEEKFKQISEAYQVLSDPERRARYDMYGTEVPRPVGTDFAGWGFINPFEIFDAVFGARRPRRRPGPVAQRGDDLREDVEITLREAATGVERRIRAEHLAYCPDCKGSASADGSGRETCPACRGTGQIAHTQATELGRFSTITTCRTCRGEGSVIANPCATCRGTGRVRKADAYTVTIPPGVESGSRIRLSGAGHAGINGGAPGDLYLFVHVQEDPTFQRRGADTLTELPITFSQAALGDEVDAPTVLGNTRLRIPAGIQSGEVLVVRGSGLPRMGSVGTGDAHYLIRVVTPDKLTPEQRELFLELARLEGKQVEAQERLIDRVKGTFSGKRREPKRKAGQARP